MFSCKQDDKYLPSDNSSTYLHENVEEYADEIISEKIKEVGESVTNKIIYNCDNVNTQVIGVILRNINTLKENNRNVPQSYYTIRMNNSCSFVCDKKEIKDISAIQIVFKDNIDTRYIEGKKARVSGQLFSANSPYHQTEILISANSLELL